MVKKFTEDHEWIEVDESGKIGQCCFISVLPCSVLLCGVEDSPELSSTEHKSVERIWVVGQTRISH